ncbi:unnamed protein product [Lepeophtheirus salmonis]|uniref:(salmon louse) hypothetical protein n=1 Tax=Lepeophtheirus salmonis TaxID=72036 RepID=A0A7R8D3N3_LEPSM|nr:unnamed protein product [Lepeophtheirus salmonis]CAF2967439.1 unnamed protein product [Lepeophtheirus salmonis]
MSNRLLYKEKMEEDIQFYQRRARKAHMSGRDKIYEIKWKEKDVEMKNLVKKRKKKVNRARGPLQKIVIAAAAAETTKNVKSSIFESVPKISNTSKSNKRNVEYNRVCSDTNTGVGSNIDQFSSVPNEFMSEEVMDCKSSYQFWRQF